MIYLQVFLNSLFLTLFATPFFITYLINQGIVDHPGDERKIHTRIIPRMGGLIVYISALIVFVSFYNDLNSIRILLIGSFVIVICGMLDDIIGLNWNIKIFFQLIATVFLLISFSDHLINITFLGFELPSALGYFILFIFVLGTINSINLMDGLDGLVTGYSLVKFFVLLILAVKYNDYFLILLFISLSGSLLGFLKFNAFPARVFLGDTGSLVLGYFLTYGALMVSKDISADISVDLVLPIIFLSTPNLDTLRVIFIRILNKSNPFLADKNHLHHLLLSLRIKHKSVVFIIHLFSSLYSFTIVIFAFYNKLLALFIYLFLLLTQLYLSNIIKILLEYKFFDFTLSLFPSFSRFLLKFYKYVLFPFTFFSIFFSFYLILPLKLYVEKSYLIVILIFLVALFFLSYYHNKKDSFFHHIYVFFNITVFIVVLIKGSQFVSDFYSILILNTPVFFAVLYVLIFISSFIFFRDYFIKKDDHFLTGIDLTIIVIMFLLNLLNQIINLELLKISSLGLFLSFVVYFWYRIIITMLPRYERHFFILSYAIPLSVILFFLVK